LKAGTSGQISQIKKEVVVVAVVVEPDGVDWRTWKRLRGRIEPETGSLDCFRCGESSDDLQSDQTYFNEIGNSSSL
jgi:hypothetical protein